jgi:hypothetical protein
LDGLTVQLGVLAKIASCYVRLIVATWSEFRFDQKVLVLKLLSMSEPKANQEALFAQIGPNPISPL